MENKRLSEIRKHLGFSQEEMGEKLGGLSQATYRHYEREGVNIPSKIVKYFIDKGFNANWIFAGVGDMLISETQYKPSESAQIKKAWQSMENGFNELREALGFVHASNKQKEKTPTHKLADKIAKKLEQKSKPEWKPDYNAEF